VSARVSSAACAGRPWQRVGAMRRRPCALCSARSSTRDGPTAEKPIIPTIVRPCRKSAFPDSRIVGTVYSPRWPTIERPPTPPSSTGRTPNVRRKHRLTTRRRNNNIIATLKYSDRRRTELCANNIVTVVGIVARDYNTDR